MTPTLILVTLLLIAPTPAAADTVAAPDTTAFETKTNPVLSLPRLVWELSTYPVGKVLIYTEHHDIPAGIFEFFTNAAGTFGVFPQIQLGGETGTGGGLRVFARSRSGRGLALDAHTIYSGNKGRQGQLVVGHPTAFGNGHGSFGLEGTVLETYNGDASINGALHGDPSRNFEIFRSDAFLRVGWQKHIGFLAETRPNLELEAWIGHALLDFDARKGDESPLTDPDATPEARRLIGIGRTFSYGRVGGSITFDRRDYRPPLQSSPHPLYEHLVGRYAVRRDNVIYHLRDRSYPTRGFLFQMAAEWARGGDDVQFGRGLAEFQAYVPLFKPGQVMALRGKVEKIHRPGGSIVPFTELVTVGGAEDARGFRRANFRGLGSIVLNAEYRYPIWDSWNAFFFWDEIQVFDALADASMDGFQTSYGGGITLRAARHLLAKFHIGHSREHNVLIGLGVAQAF